MPIINPEIRMAMTQHGEGDMIAGVLELDHSEAEPIYLGRHDFILNLGIGNVESNHGGIVEEIDIIRSELDKAMEYQNENRDVPFAMRSALCHDKISRMFNLQLRVNWPYIWDIFKWFEFCVVRRTSVQRF